MDLRPLARQVTVIIPTRNRPELLARLLTRLSTLSDEFTRVIVVDSSNSELASRVSEVVDQSGPISAKTMLLQTEVASLTHQKNMAIEICEKDAIVQILDDDVLPPKGYLASMKASLLESGLAGISGVTQEMSPPTIAQKIFGALFGLVGLKDGTVSVAGLGAPVYPNPNSSKLVSTSWLIGCSMWDLSKISGQRYFDRFVGSAQFEDVEFSLRVSKFASLAVDPSKVLFHQSAPEDRPDSFTFWFRFSRNRFEVVKIRSKLPWLIFLWSSLGLLIQVAFGKEPRKVDSINGLIRGSAAAIMQREFR